MNASELLLPDFDAIPFELRKVPRWVTWKNAKVPYCAKLLNAKASVIDPDTWAPFADARTAFEEGGWSGVGIVLNGDGLVGVDLDNCFADVPDPAALGLLERIGCQYIERSPSGRGLRGFGFGPGIRGKRGELEGVTVELYSTGRYLTVTGRAVSLGPVVPLPGFAAVAAAIDGSSRPQRKCKPTEETEDHLGHLLPPSVSSDSSVPSAPSVGLEFPTATLPRERGQRNQCVFALARYLKGTRPNASRQELRAVVQHWHSRVVLTIGTHDFSVTWGDFLRGWERVQRPFGDTMERIVQNIDPEASLPAGIAELGYGRCGLRLVRLCVALQMHHGEEPFFLSCRYAGAFLGIHFTDASRMLSALEADRVLFRVHRGTRKLASRYRFVWKPEF